MHKPIDRSIFDLICFHNVCSYSIFTKLIDTI
uniref:IcmS, IcmW, IcmO (DotL) IV secretion system, Coupling.8A n=1 Tax=Siphoviridae sp. ctgN495 TaxID=2825608 RepID=A0A8S5UCT4_9CAUD|nr:MAG TPA: IcmS, IcmW, IcmO (DotL) IV secretion system, Coupling.8A [Siphoviridae sp. ctgN495]